MKGPPVIFCAHQIHHSANLQARFSYTCNEIILDAQFQHMVHISADSDKYVVDYTRISNVEPVVPVVRVSLERNSRAAMDSQIFTVEGKRPGQSGPSVPPPEVRFSLDGIMRSKNN